jgi:hypothetical protein
MFEDLDEDNFLMYAMKAYNSPHCIMSEFEGDLKRTKYLVSKQQQEFYFSE